MRFAHLLSLLPLASAVAIPQAILPTGQTVKQDVINIHNAVLELDATVQAYDGSPFPTSLVEGTPVLLGVAKIHEGPLSIQEPDLTGRVLMELQ